MRTLADLGEFGAIARIERAARRLAGARHVVVGIGDDAAVLRPRPGEDLVISSDAAVEDVHFRWATCSPRIVGRRALVANLSDLAAMGARPLGFLLSLAAPGSLTLARLDGLLAGLLAEAERYACPLLGGNLSAADVTSLTLTVTGAVAQGRVLRRAGSRGGDRVCVTGVLGAAALELARAERGRGRIRRVPVPRLDAGRALARVAGVGGCIDISDGLDADLGHLLEGTRLRAEIDAERIPRPPGFEAACRRLGRDPEALLRGGGEDYELLFTLRPDAPPPDRLARRLGVAVTEIGRLVPGRPGSGSTAGWTHFKR